MMCMKNIKSYRKMLNEGFHDLKSLGPPLVGDDEQNDESGFIRSENELIDALVSKDHKKAKSISQEGGFDPNAEDQMGRTPLVAAIVQDQIGVVRDLIEMGADVNKVCIPKDSYPIVPIHEAIIYSDLEMLKLLIKSGANIQARGERGDTLLHTAIKYPPHHWNGGLQNINRDLIDFLIEHGIDPQEKNDEGKTPGEVIVDDPSYTNYNFKAARDWKKRTLNNKEIDGFKYLITKELLNPIPKVYKDIKDMYDSFGGDLSWWKNAPKDLDEIIGRISKTRSLFRR